MSLMINLHNLLRHCIIGISPRFTTFFPNCCYYLGRFWLIYCDSNWLSEFITIKIETYLLSFLMATLRAEKSGRSKGSSDQHLVIILMISSSAQFSSTIGRKGLQPWLCLRTPSTMSGIGNTKYNRYYVVWKYNRYPTTYTVCKFLASDAKQIIKK